VLVAVALLAAACGSNSSNTTASPSTTTPTTTTPAPTAPSTGQTTTVSIPVGAIGLTTTAYAPNPVNIKVGDSINWVNNDSIAHTSTANNGTTFNSGTIAPGGSFKATFSTAGSFAYHCAFHPGMVGTVVVQ
jgi:plastocyanin